MVIVPGGLVGIWSSSVCVSLRHGEPTSATAASCIVIKVLRKDWLSLSGFILWFRSRNVAACGHTAAGSGPYMKVMAVEPPPDCRCVLSQWGVLSQLPPTW